MTTISARDVFEFDLNGFIVKRRFLTPAVTLEIDNALSAAGIDRAGYKFRFAHLHPVFRSLMVDPTVLRLCHDWIGPYFRLDHAWGIQHRFDDDITNRNLHGGPHGEQGYFRYGWHGDKPSCSCLVFAYILEDQRPGDGGFVIVPGSHKSNLGLGGGAVFERIVKGELADAWWVVQPELERGDLLIFTEAAIHGTETWKTKRTRRRNLYYQYACGFMTWTPPDDPDLAELRRASTTLQEELVLRPPFVATREDGKRVWRRPTLVDAA